MTTRQRVRLLARIAVVLFIGAFVFASLVFGTWAFELLSHGGR